VAGSFFDAVLRQARQQQLSSEHFSVDATLIEAWASRKSFVRNAQGRRRHRHRGGGGGDGSRNEAVDFRGQRRVKDTHASTTDPEARLFRMKGKEAKLSYQGHVLIEHRHALVCTT